MSCAPHWAIGITGARVARARRATPVRPAIGHRSGSRVNVPSGKIATQWPAAMETTAWSIALLAAELFRYTGIMPVARRIAPKSGILNSGDLARIREARPWSYTKWAKVRASRYVAWFATTMQPPDCGRCSPPLQRRRERANRIGLTTAASTRYARLSGWATGMLDRIVRRTTVRPRAPELPRSPA